MKNNFFQSFFKKPKAGKLVREEDDKLNIVSLISQEIRIPLNAIVGINDLILKQDLSKKVYEHSLTLRKYTMNMVSIINDLSDINLLQKGKLELKYVPVEMTGLLKNISEYMSRWTTGKNITFAINVASSVPAVIYCDFDRLRQIILNLLSNAVKYTEKGTIELNLATQGQGENKTINFSVKDSGIGISADEIDDVFDIFYNEAAKKKYSDKPGMGLGLAIVQGLARLMGGAVSVTSVLGEGTEFTLSVKLKAASDETFSALPPMVFAEASQNEEADFYALDARVLVVDDYEINIEIIKEALDSHKISVDTAVNGKEAVDNASQKYYDMIFMDYMMPVMDGVQAAKIIREKGYRGIIVCITANVESATKEFMLASGMDDILFKPVEISEIQKKLMKWLPQRKLTIKKGVQDSGVQQNSEGQATAEPADKIFDDFLFGWTIDYAFLDDAASKQTMGGEGQSADMFQVNYANEELKLLLRMLLQACKEYDHTEAEIRISRLKLLDNYKIAAITLKELIDNKRFTEAASLAKGLLDDL